MAYVQGEHRRFMAHALNYNTVAVPGLTSVDLERGWQHADARPLDGLLGASEIDRRGAFMHARFASWDVATMYTAFLQPSNTAGIICYEREVSKTTFTKHTIGSDSAVCTTVNDSFDLAVAMGGFAAVTVSTEVVGITSAATGADAWIYDTAEVATGAFTEGGVRHRGPTRVQIGADEWIHHPTAFNLRIQGNKQIERADGFILPSVCALAGYAITGSLRCKGAKEEDTGGEAYLARLLEDAVADMIVTLDQGDNLGDDLAVTVHNVKFLNLSGPLRSDGGFTEYLLNWQAYMTSEEYDAVSEMVTIA